MEIYVQSRGQAQDRDYCWIRITDKGQQQEPPSIPKQVIDLIESDDFSVALARLSDQQVPDQLLLLVTGLESSRRDFQRRIIRNSVAWVGQKSDEPVLRAIAARALRGLLREEIDQVVKFGGDGKEGFKVSLQEIQQLAAKGKAGDLQPNIKRFIGPNSELLKQKLAEELEQHQLPQKDGPLVIVTGIKAQETLEDSGVWRGLSSLVKTEKEIPEENASPSKPHKPSNLNIWEMLRGFQPFQIGLIMFITAVGLSAVIGVFRFSPPLPFIFSWVSSPGSTICGPPTITPITESKKTGQPVKFTGVYDPKTTSRITLVAVVADQEFRLTDKSKVDLIPKECRWQFNYNEGFNMAGTRRITVEFKKGEEVIKQEEIDITVK
jgi:hypothetical protein